MPGSFGIISRDNEQRNRFLTICQALIPYTCDITHDSNCLITAHSFRGKGLVEEPNRIIAVDGEYSIYTALCNTPEELFNYDGAFIIPSSKCKGNICIFDKNNNNLYIASDLLGSFPLYYAVNNNAFVFSSRIKPIAMYLKSTPDDTGIFEFLLNGYNIGKRTLYNDIHRLRPGETLSFNGHSHNLTIKIYSRLWSSQSKYEFSKQLVDHASLLLRDSFDTNKRTMLMMSAGWDSRTLLAAGIAAHKLDNFKAYTHGDIASRELGIVDRICEFTGVDLIKQELSSEMYKTDFLRSNLGYTENIVFPHWHWAGEIAKDLDIQQVAAGIYGESFGGHYGPPAILHGADKIVSVGKYLLKIRRSKHRETSYKEDALNAASLLLRIPSIQKPWFISDDYWGSCIQDVSKLINNDIDNLLLDYQQRGINTPEDYIEAFITEQRGTQYITAQLLSCRHHVDICLPYADRQYLEFSAHLPFEKKVHNILNKAVIKSLAPDLLRHPMAATLLPAKYPIICQETSRAARKLLETGLWSAHKISQGLIKEPRMSWVNFQFLSEGNTINEIIDSLHHPYWDKNKMRSYTSNMQHTSMHPISDMLMKILTIDFCLDI